MVSLPRSGTVYTWHSLMDLSGLRPPEFGVQPDILKFKQKGSFDQDNLYAIGDFGTQFLLAKGLRRYLPEGYVLGSHIPANQHNLNVLREGGVGKIMVLVRDPRDSTISWTYHMRKEGPRMRDHHTNIFYLPERYFQWGHDRQLSYQIRTFLPMAVNWLEGWFERAAAGSGLDIHIAYYDNLSRDPLGYFKKIFDHFGISGIDCNRLSEPSVGPHFRVGSNGQWRKEFSEADIRFASDLMGTRLNEAYEIMSISNAKALLGRQFETRGEFTEAIGAYAEAIGSYPNSSELCRLLTGVLEKDGRSGDAGMIKATFALASKHIEILFVQDNDYISKVAEFIES